MRTIRRRDQPPEVHVWLPLTVSEAVAVLKRHFTPSELAELVRRLHWTAKEEETDG